MYFANFPVIPYDSVGNSKFKDVTNLLRRVAVRSKVKSNTMLFDTYDVKSGETPESIADKLYDDSELHWVILFVNNITDRYHDWPLSERQFNTFVNEKYSDADGIHHYKVQQTSGDTSVYTEVYNPTLLTDAGATSDGDSYTSATAVTNREYEQDRQDQIRKIRLLDPSYVGEFVDEFKTLMKESII